VDLTLQSLRTTYPPLPREAGTVVGADRVPIDPLPPILEQPTYEVVGRERNEREWRKGRILGEWWWRKGIL
jgi:hypothetical protein